MRATRILLGAIAVIIGATSFGPKDAAAAEGIQACAKETPKGAACRCKLSSLHPMQGAVGMMEVDDRSAAISGMKEKKLEKYEECRPVPLVLGPPGNDPRFFLTDHHHLAVALLKAGKTETVCKIEESYTTLSEKDFENLMKKENKVWLHDAKGDPLTWNDLPPSLDALKNQDDPYRSLAYYVEKKGGFNKPCSDFGEFLWAKYFKDQFVAKKLATPNKNNLNSLVTNAIGLAHDDAAKALPGYWKEKPPSCEPIPPECRK
jgi:hypothetical protein